MITSQQVIDAIKEGSEAKEILYLYARQNGKRYAREVEKMLNLQREYFDSRSHEVLRKSIAQERIVKAMTDKILEDV